MNPSTSQFLSQGNKRILWELMNEHNIFNNISDKYVSNVKTDFEICITQMSYTIKPQDSILEINKQLIIKMIKGVEKYRKETITPPLISAEEVSTKKQAQLQRGFETKKDEFNKLIQPPKPENIDFTDKNNDEPIGSEMDIKLAQTIAWREKQLSQVLETQDTSAATDWINNGKVISTSTSTSTSTATANHIKIGGPANIDERSIVNIKKVNFSDTIVEHNNTVSTVNFMDKLKKIHIPEDNNINDIALIKADISSLKTDMTSLFEQNKLLLDNLDKIMDMLIK